MHKVNGDMKVPMSDMFYLGGPLSLRGFDMRGVGPHSEGDALGATVSPIRILFCDTIFILNCEGTTPF